MSSSLAATCEVIHELWHNDVNNDYDCNYNTSTPSNKVIKHTQNENHMDFSFVTENNPDDSISLTAMVDKAFDAQANSDELDCTCSTPAHGQQSVNTSDMFASIRSQLEGLTKDTYMNKLISLTEDSVENIKQFRMSLLYRARLLEHCPRTKLYTRKNTKRESSERKYASDCFILDQFIKGDDTSEIQDIFSSHGPDHAPHHPKVSDLTFKSPMVASTEKCVGEIRLLKETVSSLAAEVGVLRGKMKDKDEQFRKITDDLTNTVRSLKSESDACNDVVSDFFTKHHPDTCIKGHLSGKIRFLLSKVNVVEVKNTQLQHKSEELGINMTNIAANVESLNDLRESFKRSEKSITASNSTTLDGVVDNAKVADDKIKSLSDSLSATKLNLRQQDKRINDIGNKTDQHIKTKLQQFSDKMLENQTVIQADFMEEVTRRLQVIDKKHSEEQYCTKQGHNSDRTYPAYIDQSKYPVQRNLQNVDNKLTKAQYETEGGYIPGQSQQHKTSHENITSAQNKTHDNGIPVIVTSRITDSDQSKQMLENVDTDDHYYTESNDQHEQTDTKTTDYFIARLKEEDTADMIIEHLEMNEINYRFVQVLVSNVNGFKYARVGAYRNTREIFDSAGFWPRYVSCRIWRKNKNNNGQWKTKPWQ